MKRMVKELTRVIKFPKLENHKNKKDMPIIPGMMTSVDIMIGKRTVLEYMLNPILRAKAMALREY